MNWKLNETFDCILRKDYANDGTRWDLCTPYVVYAKIIYTRYSSMKIKFEQARL